MKTFETKSAPLPIGPYSQAVISGELIFISGQIPIDPASGTIPNGTEDQIRTVMRNITSILSAAGAEKGHIVQVTVYLTDMEDFAIMNSVYAETFGKPYPVRTCIGVKSLPKGVRIMIDAVGEIGH